MSSTSLDRFVTEVYQKMRRPESENRVCVVQKYITSLLHNYVVSTEEKMGFLDLNIFYVNNKTFSALANSCVHWLE